MGIERQRRVSVACAGITGITVSYKYALIYMSAKRRWQPVCPYSIQRRPTNFFNPTSFSSFFLCTSFAVFCVLFLCVCVDPSVVNLHLSLYLHGAGTTRLLEHDAVSVVRWYRAEVQIPSPPPRPSSSPPSSPSSPTQPPVSESSNPS